MGAPTQGWLSGDEIRAWIEQDELVCLKAVTKEGDPVELSASEARQLGQALLCMADEIDARG